MHFRVIAIGVLCLAMAAAHALEPIESVKIGDNRGFEVNGDQFFPIMIWLQDPGNFGHAEEAGINTIAGYWPGSGDTEDVVEYIELVEDAGFYGVLPHDARLHGHPAILGFIHGDEPDLPWRVSDAEIVPADNLRVNADTPLWRIVDGTTTSWSVLDPLEGARITIKLDEPVTIESIGVWLTVSEGLAVAKEVEFSAGGEQIASATLKRARGKQVVELEEPVSLQAVTMKVISTYPGEQVWGSVGEIAGLDAAGNNVLKSPPRQVPRREPKETMEAYRAIEEAGASRPVFMTLTAYFMPRFNKWPPERRQELYRGYVEATDVVGFDVYPLYGWGRPDWLHLVHEGTKQLRELAVERPVYAWIETCKGSQWVSEERQVEITGKHIRAEVWSAICAGATAIGYFTHIWKPSYSQFGVPEENVEAMRQINDQITRLTPALLGNPAQREIRISIDGDVMADAMGKQGEDGLYIFAVNYDPGLKEGEATISVEGLAEGSTIEVVDEGRTLQSGAGEFRDHFEPLAVHIYRIE